VGRKTRGETEGGRKERKAKRDKPRKRREGARTRQGRRVGPMVLCNSNFDGHLEQGFGPLHFT